MNINLILISLLICLSQQYTKCVYGNFTHPKTHKKMNLKYDLSPLTSQANFYLMADYNTDYEYSFHFCQDIYNPWNSCSGDRGHPAYRHKNKECIRLGTTYKEAQTFLIDNIDPVLGIMLIYTSNYTHNECNGYNHRLILELYCTSLDTEIPNEHEILQLVNRPCDNIIRLATIYFCPNGCGVDRNILCSNNGKCHYDHDDDSAHCFCNQDWHGKACELPGHEEVENLNTLSYVFIATSCFLVLILVLLIAIWFFILKIRLDPKSYDVQNVGLTKYEAV